MSAHRPGFHPGVCVCVCVLDTRAQHPQPSPPGVPLNKHSGSPTEVRSIPDILHGEMDRGVWPSPDPGDVWGDLKPPVPQSSWELLCGRTWSSQKVLGSPCPGCQHPRLVTRACRPLTLKPQRHGVTDDICWEQVSAPESPWSTEPHRLCLAPSGHLPPASAWALCPQAPASRLGLPPRPLLLPPLSGSHLPQGL